MSEASVFRGVDFTGTEWQERNVDIAARLGVDPALVAAARRHFGMVVDRRIDWSGVDWGRPVKAIAGELGCSTVAVLKQRQALGLTRERIPWDEVDWTRPDAEIAEAYACTRAIVSRRRKEFSTISALEAKHAAAKGKAADVAGKDAVAAHTWAQERSARTISVLFPQAEFDALTEASERAGRRKTDVIRDAVREWIARRK